MSDRPRRLNNLDCAIAFDYGRLLEETSSKKAGYDELLIALDRAFAQSGVDATTRELLQRCAAAVGLVSRSRQMLLDEILRLAREAGVQIDIRFPIEDPQLRTAGIRRPFEMIESTFVTPAMRPITAAQRAAEIIEEVNGRACAFCHQRFEPGEHRCPARLGSDPQPSDDPPPHV